MRCAAWFSWTWLLLASATATADPPKPLEGKELVAALKKGGYVLFMRHPATHQDQADTDTRNLDNLKAQRHLTDEGRAQAKTFGDACRKLKIPIGQVLTGKYYRTIEAAKLADLGEATATIDLTDGQNISPNEGRRRAAALRRLLSEAPADGNRLIVSHKSNLQEAAGKEFGDLSEGEIAVFKPLGDKGFACVARVKIDAWPKLAEGN